MTKPAPCHNCGHLPELTGRIVDGRWRWSLHCEVLSCGNLRRTAWSDNREIATRRWNKAQAQMQPKATLVDTAVGEKS